MQLPDRPGRLSGQFAGAIGRYWSEQLRAHVLPAVVAPEGAVRPLVIEEARASAPDALAGEADGRQVAASPSSAECACAVHGVRLGHGEHSVASHVALELSMCGRARNGPHGQCPLHQEKTPQRVRLARAARRDAVHAGDHRDGTASSARRSARRSATRPSRSPAPTCCTRAR